MTSCHLFVIKTLMCACVRVCSSQAIPLYLLKSSSSNLAQLTASNMGMHHVLIIVTLAFIQGHTDLNHENNKCLIISETTQAMHIKFAVKIVRLKVYMTIVSPTTLPFIQGHKCVSDLTTFLICNILDNILSY